MPEENGTDPDARRDTAIKRMASLLRRLKDNEAVAPGEFKAASDELQDAGPARQEAILPTPEQRERHWRSLEAKYGPLPKKELFARAFAAMQETVKEMTRPGLFDLESAASKGDIAEVRRLLDLGLDPNGRSRAGGTILHSALLFDQFEAAELLIERGATVGIHEAAAWGRTDLLRSLLDSGADPNAPGASGETPLHRAVYKGHIDAVRLLLERGAQPDTPSDKGYRPLTTACAQGYPEIAHLLVAARGTPLSLTEAAAMGDLPALTRLLDDGADIDARNDERRTPLMAAAASGQVEAARLLLQRGARADITHHRGGNALALAVSRQHVPIIHLLIDHGADPNAVQFRTKSSLLHWTVTMRRLRAAEALIARGADVNARSESGGTPLHQCMLFSDARLSSMDSAAGIARLLLDAGADIEARDSLGKTPLMTAASHGNADAVRLLLERGADPHATVPEHHLFTPLNAARSSKNPEVLRLISEALGPNHALVHAAETGDLARVIELADAGAPLDTPLTRDPAPENAELRRLMETTPLRAAAAQGHEEIVRFLLERGMASGAIRPSSLDDALATAETMGQEAVARILRDAGALSRGKRAAGNE